MDADAVEIRVLGCLIEKQRTTPDAYPLSLNSLRLACNQATARDPVVAYDEREIKAALDRMSTRGWTRFASGASSRALKYRHLLDEALHLSDAEVSLLGVDRKSTRLNSSHLVISYAVFCLKKKNMNLNRVYVSV